MAGCWRRPFRGLQPRMGMNGPVTGKEAKPGAGLSATDVGEIVGRACEGSDYREKRVLLIVPDGTRTAPVGMLFKALHSQLGGVTEAFDVLIALGTHQPMS